MANLKSSRKDIERSKVSYLRNKHLRTKVSTYMKRAESLLNSQSATRDSLTDAIRCFESVGMKAAKTSAINSLTISRKVSRLTLRMKARFGHN